MSGSYSSGWQVALSPPIKPTSLHLPSHPPTNDQRKDTQLPYSIFSEALGLLSVQVKRFSKGEASRLLLSN
jgi:hypothetical protein